MTTTRNSNRNQYVRKLEDVRKDAIKLVNNPAVASLLEEHGIELGKVTASKGMSRGIRSMHSLSILEATGIEMFKGKVTSGLNSKEFSFPVVLGQGVISMNTEAYTTHLGARIAQPEWLINGSKSERGVEVEMPVLFAAYPTNDTILGYDTRTQEGRDAKVAAERASYFVNRNHANILSDAVGTLNGKEGLDASFIGDVDVTIFCEQDGSNPVAVVQLPLGRHYRNDPNGRTVPMRDRWGKAYDRNVSAKIVRSASLQIGGIELGWYEGD